MLLFVDFVCQPMFLYYRQTYSVDFLIDVDRIDIRHATDVIQYRHDSLLQILVLYVVLAATLLRSCLE